MPLESIETADLVVFDAVARTGSFGGAAVELQLSQPSVSTRMSALERRLQAKLFTRGARGTTLTPAGTRFLGYARRCLELLDEARLAVRRQDLSRLTLTAPASLATTLFRPILKALAEHPLDVRCRVATSDEAITLLLDGAVDAAFVVHRVLPASLQSRLVARSPFVAVCGPDHPLAERDGLSPEDLTATKVAVHYTVHALPRPAAGSDPADELANLFAHPERDRHHPVQLVGAPDVAVELAADADYVAVVPLYAASQALNAGRVRLLPLTLPNWQLEIWLAHRADSEDHAGLRRLLQELPAVTAAAVPA
ncbi:LysR family transcriptional regulator [Actinoallomurus acanthiterrae]